MTRRERPDGPRRIDLIESSVPVLFHAVLLASVFLLVSGHNQPGGGFVGGMVAGAALAMRFITGGLDELRHVARLRPWTFLGTGIVLAAVTATAPLVAGGHVLESYKWELDLAVVGHVPVSSTLLFDLGVYLLVIGLVLMVFEAFGDDEIGALTVAPGTHDRRGST